MKSKVATNCELMKSRSLIMVGLLFLVMVSFQPAFAVTDYVFFSVNGDTSATSMVQGDTMSWGANCDIGAMLTWEIWIDLNSNSVIDPSYDRQFASFDIADGDVSPNGPPPDNNPIPDGWYISQPMILGMAPAHYIFKARNHVDNSTAQRMIICIALPSPPNMFRGRVTVAGHPAPDSVFLRNIWVEAGLNEGGNQMWSALTDDSGLYQINVGAIGNGLEYRIEPMDIPGFITPAEQRRIASGIVDSVNFAFGMPTDSIYGELRDGFGALITTQVDGYCEPRFPGPNEKDFTATNGSYKVFFGGSEYGLWNIGLRAENLVPAYLCPNGYDFDNSQAHSQRHDFTCHATDTVIYARVTELGGPPSHQYLIMAQSMSLQSGTFAISGTGGSNIATLHISSLDQNGWQVNVANWDDGFPIPPGYILDGGDQYWNRNPGDTISLNFIYGNMVRDTLRLDPGDPPIEWYNVWVDFFNGFNSFGTQADNNGVYTAYGDTGTYTISVHHDRYLAYPSQRTLHLVADTTGGLGFMLNETHCNVSGTLVNVPLPIPGWVGVFAHTGNGNDGYSAWTQVDSVSGAFSLRLCDGNWTIDPPMIPYLISPPPVYLSISERPDTARVVNLIYSSTSIEGEDDLLPGAFSLKQNYPNPFNAQTMIEYGLPEAAFVKIEIYDITGRKMETLVSSNQEAGYHQVTWDAGSQVSGIYFYRIKADGAAQTRKMLLVK